MHYVVSGWLDANAPRWVSDAWQAVTLFDKVQGVRGNLSIGIRLLGPNKHYNGFVPVGGQCIPQPLQTRVTILPVSCTNGSCK